MKILLKNRNPFSDQQRWNSFVANIVHLILLRFFGLNELDKTCSTEETEYPPWCFLLLPKRVSALSNGDGMTVILATKGAFC